MRENNKPCGNLSAWTAAAAVGADDADDDAVVDVSPVRSLACAPFSSEVRRRFYRWKFDLLASVRRQVLLTKVRCVSSSPVFVSAVSRRHRVRRSDELDHATMCSNFYATRDGDDDGDSRYRCYQRPSHDFCEAIRCVGISLDPRPPVGIWKKKQRKIRRLNCG